MLVLEERRKFSKHELQASVSLYLHLYLIVPIWNALAAYRVRMVEPWCRAKIPMARPNEPDMPTKRTKKVRLEKS